MRYLRNYLLIFIIRISNIFGRALVFKKKVFSSKVILEKNFLENETFNFVQVGANDGISFDFLYDFVIKRKSEGVVIEPVKEYFTELTYNYRAFPEIIKVNKAVHPTERLIVINKISPSAIQKYPDWVKGIASLDSEHHLKTGIDSNDIIQEEVKANSLMSILYHNLKNKKIDYFQVDTEGFDFEILKGLNFESYRPFMIKYEKVNLKASDQNQLKVYLKRHGYFLFDEFGDTIAVNLAKIKLY
ncbi:FkbM family methyltransferase [Flavobacterium sp. FlaQc-57]|uniref:FkbM family methyltransferase n=1 Tax=Flavobacterium sp. FlaQc-57 TaxID=3374186 RepID=UPI0037580847